MEDFEDKSRPSQKGFTIYVIYKDPEDYPGRYVLRRWVGFDPDQEPMLVCDTLEEARKGVPFWCVQLSPRPEEAAVIEEVWL